MLKITVKCKDPNQSEMKEMELSLNTTTKASMLKSTIASEFSIDPSDYVIIYDPDESNIPSQKHKVIEDNDLISSVVSSNSIVHIIKRSTYEVIYY